MQSSQTTAGTVLALLAICLQALVYSMGGRVCFRTSPFVAEESCASECCDEPDSTSGYSRVLSARPDVVSPFMPGEPGCCLVQPPEYLAQQTDRAEVRGALALAPVVYAGIGEPFESLRPLSHQKWRAVGQWMPPPDEAAVRVTVLLI